MISCFHLVHQKTIGYCEGSIGIVIYNIFIKFHGISNVKNDNKSKDIIKNCVKSTIVHLKTPPNWPELGFQITATLLFAGLSNFLTSILSNITGSISNAYFKNT